jgi:hypothetical protein
MPPIQLNRLQSQTTALSHLFDDPAAFCTGLLALFKVYEKKNASTRPNLLNNNNEVNALNIPAAVYGEFIKSIEPTAKENPRITFQIVDQLWKYKILEMRLTAIHLLTGINNEFLDDIVQRLQTWLSSDLHEYLLEIVIAYIKQNALLAANEKWWLFLENLTQSQDEATIILGLRFISAMLSNDSLFYPRFNNLLLPLIQHPKIKITKYLLETIKSYRYASQPEAASFLMMATQLYPSKEVFLFFRKCLPFFDDFFNNQLRNELA